MPDKPSTTDAPAGVKMDTQQLTTFWPAFEQQLYKFLPAHEEVKEYVEMLQVDTQARQALAFASNLVINLIGDYSHADEEIEIFVRQALRNMKAPWSFSLRWLLQAQVIGYGVMEKVWGDAKIEGKNAWVFDALVPVVPESISFAGIIMESALGQPKEIIQWYQYGEGSAVHLPGKKAVHWSFQDRGDGYGDPLGKGMLPLYRGKKVAMTSWASAIAWRGTPPIYEVVPQVEVEDPRDGQKKQYADLVATSWKEAKNGAVIMRPQPAGDWAGKGVPNVQVLRADSFGDEFFKYVDYAGKAYSMALGIPALVQGESQYGTRAQSAVQTDTAKLGALPTAEEFSESCLMRDIVKPLVDINFGEQDDYGEFPCAIPLDEEYFAGILTSLAGAGVAGMMVPFRVYQHLQAVLPSYLPALEEVEYYAEQAEPGGTVLPAGATVAEGEGKGEAGAGQAGAGGEWAAAEPPVE